MELLDGPSSNSTAAPIAVHAAANPTARRSRSSDAAATGQWSNMPPMFGAATNNPIRPVDNPTRVA